MTDKKNSNFDAALKAIRRYLLQRGNNFDRGPSYEGNGDTLPSVKKTVNIYESLGYRRLVESGNPPVYAALRRGHREIHIFQLDDSQVGQWLEDDKATLNDPAIRAYIIEKSGVQEGETVVTSKPRHFHINEVDNVFIVTTDDPD